MHGTYQHRITEQKKIERQLRQGADKIVAAPNWAEFAKSKRGWPNKTAAHLAAIAGRDPRTAERWLSGEFEPPLAVVLALIVRMFARD